MNAKGPLARGRRVRVLHSIANQHPRLKRTHTGAAAGFSRASEQCATRVERSCFSFSGRGWAQERQGRVECHATATEERPRGAKGETLSNSESDPFTFLVLRYTSQSNQQQALFSKQGQHGGPHIPMACCGTTASAPFLRPSVLLFNRYALWHQYQPILTPVFTFQVTASPGPTIHISVAFAKQHSPYQIAVTRI